MLESMPASYFALIPLAFFLGAYGTLIGSGGGFVLVPMLLMLYPSEPTEIITAISLAVVFFNALSGTLAYGRMKRIEYRSGLVFAAATIPGAIIGALATAYFPRGTFDAFFGVLLIAASLYLGLRPAVTRPAPSACPPNHRECILTEADGTVHHFSYNEPLGIAMSTVVGFFSSLLGIGGGVIHVPILVRVLNFPVHVATATSQLVLTIMALSGTITHIASGSFTAGFRRTIMLAIGATLGAPVGAWFSRRLQGSWIIRALAVALGIVGLRLATMALL